MNALPPVAMTMDLWMLVACAVLAPLLVLPGLLGRQLQKGGVAWALGNREQPMEFPPWVQRAGRAHANLLENLPTFTALILVAHLIGKADGLALLGAEVFFAARVAHAIVYIAGIPVVRTVVFLISLVGEFMILANILS